LSPEIWLCPSLRSLGFLNGSVGSQQSGYRIQQLPAFMAAFIEARISTSILGAAPTGVAKNLLAR